MTLDRQTIKDIAYSRQRLVAACAHWPIMAVSLYWLYVVGRWIVYDYEPQTMWARLFGEMAIFPLLYLLSMLFLYPYIWMDRGIRYFRYSFWATDRTEEEMRRWLASQGWRYGQDYRRGDGDWYANEDGNKWRNEFVFSRLDQWMIVKLKYYDGCSQET